VVLRGHETPVRSCLHSSSDTPFLYEHADLRAEIEALRAAETDAPARLTVSRRGSEASLRTRLRAALADNQELRQQIAGLREELALAHGRNRELGRQQRTGR